MALTRLSKVLHMRAFGKARAISILIVALCLKLISERLLIRKDPQLTLSTLIGWRYPPFLLQACVASGTVAVRWSDCGRALEILGWQVFLRKTLIADLLPKQQRGVLLHESRYGRILATERKLPLEGNYYQSLAQEDGATYVLPYFCHPSLYHHQKIERHRELALPSIERSILVFYSGSKGPAYKQVGRDFGILDRCQIVDYVEAALSSSLHSELAAHCVLYTSDDVSQSLQKHRLDQNAYLKLLGHSHFALCPPGWKVPHAHNIIEALAMGCVPITNYAHLMTPPLCNNKNCLAFTSLEELGGIIDRLAQMPPEMIKMLHQEANRYYRLYLDPASVGETLLARLPMIRRVSFNDESGL